jgi:tetratricopeptide (TPR) repeat protein
VKALRLIIDLCSEFGPPAELRKHAAILLAERPDLGDAADIHLAVARSYLSERDYEGAVKYLDAVIARDEKDPNVVLYNIVLFDALTGTGDLDRMEELMHIILADYPGRIEAGISGEPRVQAELWLDIATFWLGFVSYSLGHIQESENWFLKSEEHLETKIKERKAQGKPINPVVDVFLKFRTKDYRLYLRDFHGKVPEVDLDLGDLWATKSTLSFRESIGKVVAVVFREPGNDRAATFLQEIDGLVKQRGKDGLSGAVLSYVIGPERPGDAERLRAEMSADLEKLGVSLPAGYDPDRKSQSIMRRLHATVGPSTTCIVFNRRGEAAWYIADPRDMDRAIARRVIERLLKE